MYLIYINEIGVDHKGLKQYEFLFSSKNTIEEEEVNEEWFEIPATSNDHSKLPKEELISFVGLLKNSDIELELIQNSYYFGVIDAIEGVIALGWEVYDSNSENERLYFRFGETLEQVATKIKDRGYTLLKEKTT